MKIRYIKNEKDKCIKLSNWLFLNRATFGIVKWALRYNVPQLRFVKFSSLKPLKKSIKDFSKTNENFNIVEINSKNGNYVKISL